MKQKTGLIIVALVIVLFILFALFKNNPFVPLVSSLPSFAFNPPASPKSNDIETMFHQEAHALSDVVIDKILTTLKCAKANHIEHKQILAVVDYSLPSSEKRLWIFDLNEKKLLFHTYVSHGLKSGALISNFFSNQYNSKASSIGVYKTEQAYYGREGLSLRLDGLDRNFNDNASNRSVVMHGGWYVEESFIKRYGRAGRSWGCPAVPLSLYQAIINTIKDNALFVIYYPSDRWFLTSKFLTCEQSSLPRPPLKLINHDEVKPEAQEASHREAVLFANIGPLHSKLEESAPILAVTAPSYEQLFQTPPPLTRMLRRQIDHVEYIALSTDEVKKIVEKGDKSSFKSIYFVLPTLKMVHGYYETVMKIMNLGEIKDISMASRAARHQEESYVVHFESSTSINLISTNRFIRWLGL